MKHAIGFTALGAAVGLTAGYLRGVAETRADIRWRVRALGNEVSRVGGWRKGCTNLYADALNACAPRRWHR